LKQIIKDKFLFALKYGIGLVLLGWILLRVDRESLVETLLSLGFYDLFIIVIISFLNLAIQINLWRVLISSHSHHYHLRDLLPSFFAGFAFRLMIPGGHAEITKIFLLRGRKRGKAIAFGVEKSFQTVFKIILISLAVPLVFPEYKLALWSFAFVVIIGIFLLPIALKKEWFTKHQEKDVSYYKIFAISFLHSVPMFLIIALQYYYLLSLSFEIKYFQTFIVTIFILGAGLVPISVSGLGVRENLAVFFLGQFDIPGYSAVAISLLVFFINAIIPAIIGVFVIVKRKHDLKDAGSELKKITQSVYQKGKQRYQEKKKKANE